MLAFFLMPMASILSVTAEDLTVILLGEKWRAAGTLLSIIALRGISHVVEGSQGWLHLSIGRADRWQNWGVVSLLVQVVAVLAGLPFGTSGVAVAVVLASSLIALPSITYAGLAPGYVGVYQVNAQLPDNAPAGNAVSLAVSVNEMTSNIVTIAIQ